MARYFHRNEWGTDHNIHSDPYPGTRRSDARSSGLNSASTRRRLDNERNNRRIAAANARERERRRAVADRRRAVADRRAGFQRASDIAGRAPGILSAFLALLFICLIGSRFATVVAGTSQMEHFFEANLAVSEDFLPVWGMTTVFNEEGEDPWLEGSYITIADTIEEIGKLSDGESDPFKIFSAFTHDMVKGTVMAIGGDIYKGLADLYKWVEELDPFWAFEPSIMLPILGFK